MKKLLLSLILLAIFFFPIFGPSEYVVHMAILIFIWSYVATCWSYMGRFGLVSLGHGAFLGIGAYTSGLLFNYIGISPWIGMILGGMAALSVAVVIGYACFRFGVIGDYFALLTLALGELVALILIAFRDYTGGSLGFTIKSLGTSPLFFQFQQKMYFYYISLVFLIAAIVVWKLIDISKMQKALKAIGEDEVASSTLGVRVIRYKLYIMMISAFMTALGGVLYAQYITYLNPNTLAGVGPSLEIAFKAILGGMFSLWGPTIGTALIVCLEEYIRVSYGVKFIGISQIIYGAALVILIIFLPKGIYGSLEEFLKSRFRSHS